LSENTTYEIRKTLYSSIVRKNIGWFDDKDNGISVLTSAMASDTSIINGVSTESLGPYFEGIFALFGGLAIGFVKCWQMSCICLAMTPIMVLGNYLDMKM